MSIYIFEIVLIWLMWFLCFKTTHFNFKNKKIIFLIFSLSLMALILGLRSNKVGEDTEHYVDFFNNAENIPWKYVFTKLRITWKIIYGFHDNMENGFVFIAKVVHIFTENPQIFLLVIAFLTMGFFGKFIYDNSSDVFFSTYVLLCECLYMTAFNGCRQILAVAIGINSYTYIKKGKIVPALLFIALATMIHTSACVYMTLIPVVDLGKKLIPNSRKRVKAVFLICVLIPLLIPVAEKILIVVLPRYASYLSNNYWKVSIGGTMMLWAIELFFVYILYRKRFVNPETCELAMLILMYLTLEVISLKISIFGRVAWYFRGFLLLFFPEVCRSCRINSNGKILKILVLSIITVAFFKYANVDTRTYSFFLK